MSNTLNFNELSSKTTTLEFGNADKNIDDVTCTVDTTFSLNIFLNSVGLFDLNFKRGLFSQFDLKHEDGTIKSIVDDIRVMPSKRTATQLNNAFEDGKIYQIINMLYLESLNKIKGGYGIFYEDGIPKNWGVDVFNVKLNNKLKFISIKYEDGKRLNWGGWYASKILHGIRKNEIIAFEDGKILQGSVVIYYEKSSFLRRSNCIVWQDGRPIYYRKQKIAPWETKPTYYKGSTDLDFLCKCTGSTILNFGSSECIPNIKAAGVVIVNDLIVYREDDQMPILLISGTAQTDRSKWCWSYSITLSESEANKTKSSDGEPVVIVIKINNNIHRMLVEERTRSEQFGRVTYTINGRSPTALLDYPASPTRSFLQESERTSVQLVQAELDRVSSTTVLNWQLIDALGWVLQENSFTYSNSSPISAIKTIAEAGGGFVYSEPDKNVLTIAPLYKKLYWEQLDTSDYDMILSSSSVIDLSTNDQYYPDYNCVFLTNDRSGAIAKVIRTGSAGDVIYEQQNNTLYTSASVFESAGKVFLAKAGLVETHTMQAPVAKQARVGDVLAYDGRWWGIIDAVSLSYTYDKITQSITVERVNKNE